MQLREVKIEKVRERRNTERRKHRTISLNFPLKRLLMMSVKELRSQDMDPWNSTSRSPMSASQLSVVGSPELSGNKTL